MKTYTVTLKNKMTKEVSSLNVVASNFTVAQVMASKQLTQNVIITTIKCGDDLMIKGC